MNKSGEKKMTNNARLAPLCSLYHFFFFCVRVEKLGYVQVRKVTCEKVCENGVKGFFLRPGTSMTYLLQHSQGSRRKG